MLWFARALLSVYLVLCTTSVSLTRGRQVNVTIDDQLGDPTNGQVIKYNPPDAWRPGQNCQQCGAKPNPKNAHNGTWMDGKFFPRGQGNNGVSGQIISATVPFIGVAVYVNVILTGSLASPVGNSDYTFSIDNGTSHNFRQTPNGDNTYHFNQTIFSQANLSNSLHTLTIESGRGGNFSLVLLDSVIYTKVINDGANSSNKTNTSNSADSPSSSSNVGTIIGPVIGGVIVAGAIIASLLFRRRRRQGQRIRILIDDLDMQSISPARSGSSGESAHIDPFIIDSSGPPRHDIRSTSSPGAGTSQSELISYPAGTQASLTEPTYNPTAYPQLDVTSPLTCPPAYTEIAFPAVSSDTTESRSLPAPISKSAHTQR